MKQIESKCRNRTVEENLRVWEEMKKGSEEGLGAAMRLKIDMKVWAWAWAGRHMHGLCVWLFREEREHAACCAPWQRLPSRTSRSRPRAHARGR